MTLYEFLRDYGRHSQAGPDPDSATPELGKSLSLFHASLVECGLAHEGPVDKPRLTASPGDIEVAHLSHFIVAFLPFNSVSQKTDMNQILFEVFSFFKWLDKKDIAHGLGGMDVMRLIQDLTAMQNRCLRLSHLLDDESGRVLEDPPEIQETLNDVFSVTKIENDKVHLKGRHHPEVVRLRLPSHILPLVQLGDHLDLVLGDTTEKWVLLEAGQVFPDYSPEGNLQR